jgi:hypothetical protein
MLGSSAPRLRACGRPRSRLALVSASTPGPACGDRLFGSVGLGYVWSRDGVVLTAIQIPGRFDLQDTLTVTVASVSRSVVSGYRARPVTVLICDLCTLTTSAMATYYAMEDYLK